MPFLLRAIGQPFLLFAPVLLLPLVQGNANGVGDFALRAMLVVVVALGSSFVALASLRRMRGLV
jgi:hypothetical protein